MRVYVRSDKEVFAQLPPHARRPIEGSRCCCPYCKDHPEEAPRWDAINLTGISPLYPYGFPVHYPGLEFDPDLIPAPATTMEAEAVRRYAQEVAKKLPPFVHPCGG